jgi:hypothetical protein
MKAHRRSDPSVLKGSVCFASLALPNELEGI